MSQTYTVQAGDTLLAIAIQQQVDFNQILALNPKYQPNPDLIQIGRYHQATRASNRRTQ